MAHIHGSSNCTKYLMNGIKPIKGKKPATLEELHHLYNNYQDVLNETAFTITKERDDLILKLSNSESRLDRQIKDDIAKRTEDADARIQDLHTRIEASESFIRTTGMLVQYLIADLLRSHRIHSPSAAAVRELHTIQYNKAQAIATKSFAITKECNNVKSSYEFLKNNQKSLFGADGEEFVISVLSVAG